MPSIRLYVSKNVDSLYISSNTISVSFSQKSYASSIKAWGGQTNEIFLRRHVRLESKGSGFFSVAVGLLLKQGSFSSALKLCNMYKSFIPITAYYMACVVCVWSSALCALLLSCLVLVYRRRMHLPHISIPSYCSQV